MLPTTFHGGGRLGGGEVVVVGIVVVELVVVVCVEGETRVLLAANIWNTPDHRVFFVAPLREEGGLGRLSGLPVLRERCHKTAQKIAFPKL